METINTIKDAATKVIWGDPEAHKEPVSGRMGNTAAGEPYDAGNIESTSTALKTTNPNPEVEPINTPLKTENTDKVVTNAEFNKNANPSATSVELPPATPSEKPSATTTAVTTNDDADSSKPDTNPAAAQPSSNIPGDSTHAQIDTRAPTNPLAVHHSVGETGKPDAKKNVDDSGDGVDKSDNPVKIDGPGPRPLEVVAKEHGGDAGAKARDERKGQRSSSVDTQEDHEDGTGELYVRSSGLKADGGDFDAAAPGAGKEADRLMEEEKRHPHHRETTTDKHSDKKHHISLPHHKKKDSGYEHGVEDGKAKESVAEDHTGNGSATTTHDKHVPEEEVAHNWDLKSTRPADLEHKEKTSLKEKIKQKLHRGSVGSN
ncbi:uncharacterized protein QC763_708020 [Podospora pseudopauciseta]|uniref:Hypervirulence associated protein TUDOR domain-containing protein n=1 Tax=Podospora pseudopauciseta TaxID=2093780 RepID=A0ABR0H1S5_9PEZI|nr:hypothetical protein QC763_708020 [Podospora pseudopauciseta]